MQDTITQSRTGEDIYVLIAGRDVPLLDVEWDISRPVSADGSTYGEAERVEFVQCWYGNLKITRNMLIEMMSEAEVEALEYTKWIEEMGA